MSKKRILIVSYYFSPSPTPRAIRWVNLAEDFIKNGHQVTVLTSSNEMNGGEISPTYVIEVNENILGRIRNIFLSRKNKDTTSTSIKEKKFKVTSFFTSIARFFYKILILVFQWPDFSWTWVSEAKKKAFQIIKEHGDFDIVISVSHPFSSHVVAKSIKKKYPDIDWILDNGDPFSLLKESKPNNFFLYKALNKRVERNYMNLSKYFCVTTDETKDMYEDLSQNNANKIKVIGPLLSEEANSAFKEHHKKDVSVLVFSFIGTIYKKLRNPEPIIKFFDKVFENEDKTVMLNFYGDTNDVDINNYLVKNINLYFHGQVSRLEALAAMKKSDFLINIGNTTSYQLPSKVVEYLASQKPIINISSIDNDSSKRVLSNFSNTLNINIENLNSVKEMDSFLQLCEQSTDQTLSHDERDISEFSLKSISQEYQKLFD